ncbi:hypothetical protein DH21_02345 [Serratia marcescens]|nr:hypothetical protein DH21_02345 [Serratia marcescens]
MRQQKRRDEAAIWQGRSRGFNIVFNLYFTRFSTNTTYPSRVIFSIVFFMANHVHPQIIFFITPRTIRSIITLYPINITVKFKRLFIY